MWVLKKIAYFAFIIALCFHQIVYSCEIVLKGFDVLSSLLLLCDKNNPDYSYLYAMNIKKISIRSLLLLLILFTIYLAISIVLTRRTIIYGSIKGNNVPITDARSAEFEHAVVTGASGEKAQEVALNLIENGGNAMDAALAMSMAQIVQSGGSGMSFAGRMVLLYYDKKSDSVYCMNASFNSPLNGISNSNGNGKYVPIPGFFKGVESAHNRFGSLPFNRLIQPSIDLASSGIVVSHILSQNLQLRKELFEKHPESFNNFQTASGKWPKEGDTLVQHELASTLIKIRDEGIDYFYKGSWTQKVIEKVNSIGGDLCDEDFESYEAIWCNPIHTLHNGFDVYALGYPSFGGYHLLEALNIIECAGLKDSIHYSKSPESLYWMSQIFKAGNFTRGNGQLAQNLQPPNLEKRINKGNNQKVWEFILKNKGYRTVMKSYPEMPHTDGAIVIDSNGNMAAILHSMNTYAFGETGLIIDGISISDAMHHQVDIVKAIKPGVRIPDPGTPLMIIKNGKPFGCFSSIGAGMQTRMISVISNILDFRMSLEEALNQPAIGALVHFNGEHFMWGEYQTIHSGNVSNEFITELNMLGLNLIRHEGYSGFVSGAIIDSITQYRIGVTTNQLNGVVLGN